jgi:nicotinate-nucleotide adenylyltransferase
MKDNKELKNTIIYGGAFNPPTRAHQMILQACINQAENMHADVWLLPSGDRSDKTIDVTREMRLRMLDALTQDVVARTVAVGIDTTELDRDEPTETYDTVVDFKTRYPDRRIYWVYGSDSVATMSSWKNGEQIKDEPMLVIERPGYPVKNLGRQAVILAVDAIEISSTQVRERLELHESIDDLVTPSVLAQLQAGR